MANFETLIQKFWSNQATKEELKTLSELLLHYKQNGIENIMDNLKEIHLNQNDQLLSTQKVDAILNRVHEKLGIPQQQYQPAERKHNIRQVFWFAAAAACLTMVFMGVRYLVLNQNPAPNTIAKKIDANKMLLIETVNKTDTIQNIALQDGSLIELHPTSAVSYYQPFRDSSRDISLQGIATFKVAKDKTKPFTVFAADFATTALGTRFEINTLLNHAVTVKLMEGEVLIKTMKQGQNPMADVYLTRGQKFTYNLNDKMAKIIGIDGKDIAQKAGEKEKTKSNAELSFTSLPLNVVFQNLESELNIVIIYDLKSMSEKTFSGKFIKGDGAKKILDKIATQMGLKIRMDKGAFYVD